jgi:hypothetical protein
VTDASLLRVAGLTKRYRDQLALMEVGFGLGAGEVVGLTHDRRLDVLIGSIFEGPFSWPVRPVAEIFYEREFGTVTAISGLIGAIWRLQENLSFDAGLREAWVNARPVSEIRLGFTVGFATW